MSNLFLQGVIRERMGHLRRGREIYAVGAINIIQGLTALLKETTYVIPGGEGSLWFTTNFDTWGWTLIIWGVVVMLSAGSLFAGRGWGRWFGIVAIIVNMIVQIAGFPPIRCEPGGHRPRGPQSCGP